MFNFFKKTIKVIFVNDATGDTIGVSEMKQEQLPEAFDKPATMQIDDKEWQVMKADPIYARDFSNTKKLTLHLRNIERINLQDIRFSIPTISNELCLQQFDQADDEFCSIAARYGLVLTVWCRGQTTTV